MARRGLGGGMTALRAALGAVTGVAEGARIQEAAAAEKRRMADALARQTRMDTSAQEDRAEAKADRLRSQRQSLLAGGYIPTGRDMPGATPRQAVNTETVGGQDFALYSTPRQLAMQAALEAAELKAKFKPDTMTPYEAERIRQNDLDRASREKIAAGRASGGAGGLSAKTREAMRTAEAWFNAPNKDPEQVNLARNIFVSLRDSRPDAAPQELMLDAYNAVKEQMKMANTAAQIAQRQRSNQPTGGGRAPRSVSAPPGMGGASATTSQTETDDLEAAYTQYKRK